MAAGAPPPRKASNPYNVTLTRPSKLQLAAKIHALEERVKILERMLNNLDDRSHLSKHLQGDDI